jgi:hypothetical protein
MRVGQHWCNCVADLSRDVYLPVEISAIDMYVKEVVVLMRSIMVHGYQNIVLMEVDPRDGEF